MDPWLEPAATGVNTTENAHHSSGSMYSHLLTTEKGPTTSTGWTPRGAVPLFVTKTSNGPLVVPTACFGNVRVLAENSTPGAGQFSGVGLPSWKTWTPGVLTEATTSLPKAGTAAIPAAVLNLPRPSP